MGVDIQTTYFMSHHSIDPQSYDQQLQDKIEPLKQRFLNLGLAPEVVSGASIASSQPKHYRLRAEFRIWHDGDDMHYAMFDPKEPKTPIYIEQFDVASETINRLMRELKAAVQPQQSLRRRLFQVEFLSTLAGDSLIALMYHRQLNDEWEQAAQDLSEKLNCPIIGRARKQKIVIGRDYVNETLTVDGQSYHYRQYEGSFTQPNGGVNQAMLSWARARLGDSQDQDLLELYCGNGNFTIPLAAEFRRIIATEISKASIAAATHNLETNSVSNVEFARLSSEDMTSALKRERPFRRLAHIDLDSYDLQTALVDPPRAGLDPASRELIAGFPRVLYISCNPDTLIRDIQELSDHKVTHLAFFDQFPYTAHMECGVLLEK